ncbi:SIR2 family protein [Archangium lansingense]|uniref:SIR2 family protein n=1 Tax=Archangium lansingense TaxID=2995310 RepID=A0ABT4API0_9BACT|nr:SIR2 family protein [Archangium lansinium]MCY1083181.1 SIR2 family protein [Archangium lansinium]
MASDIIDFQSERGRHEELLGREDVMAELDALVLGGPSRGWVLVKGGPGMGKSALLAEWLKRREDAGLPVPPHHFLRRGVEDWDRPEVIKRNLAAQVERLYPALAEPDARPESRLRELLQRVSDKELKPRNDRLVLVVDGLDEVEGDSDGSNPLKRFLPHVLPPGVKVLCASRPTYPYLSWLEGLEAVRTLDLDGERWAGSNKNVVHQYWEHVAPWFVPPLTPAFVREVVQRAEGNVLYTVKLAEWLHEQPVEKRRAELLPRGLEALLDESWGRIQQLPEQLREVAREGLWVVAVAREALPLSVLAAVAHWKDSDGERFLRVARSFLLEETAYEGREKAWRPFHESFRSFILSKLGHERERGEHRRLAEQLCRWPVETSERGFRWSYALRHGVTHWLKAGKWEQARGLYMNLGYLEEKCRVAGVLSLEDALMNAAVEGPENLRELPRALHRAVQAESHRLRTEPESLSLLVYNQLRSSGWTETRIEKTLCFPDGLLPALRLRHPVKAEGNERTLEGHGAPVNSCAVTPDGRCVVSASADKTLKVWELETGRELVTLEGHDGVVTGCAVMPDGRRVVSASEDGTLKVWELETGRELATLVGHGASVTACAVTPDGRRLVSASVDSMLKMWDVATGTELFTLEGHRRAVRCCTVTPDGQCVISASDDRTLKVWEVETGRALATFQGHGRAVKGCSVTPDGRCVVSASADKTLKVWELRTGRELVSLKGHEEGVWGCVVMPDGRRVVSVSFDRSLKVWELETGRELAVLRGHGGLVSGCAMTPDGLRVVSASWDRTLRVWGVDTGMDLGSLLGHGDRVRSCAMMPDGRRVVSASDDGTLKVWDAATGRELSTLKGHKDKVWGCAVTPDGRRVVSASDDGTLKVWDAATGRELFSRVGHRARVRSCAVTPDGRRMVSASDDKTLKVWDVGIGRNLVILKGHQSWVSGCVVTPDGRHVVSASDDETLKVWEVETGRELVTLKGHEALVRSCAVTPDGSRVVSASDDWTLKVWELGTGRELATLKGHGGGVRGCAVTLDGMRVVSASADKTVKVWDIESGRCLHTLYGAGAFLCVASTDAVICAGDVLGNVWILEMEPSVHSTSPSHTNTPAPGPTMSVPFPKPVLDAYRAHSLALFIGSGLSLGRDVKGNFPTWLQLPHRLLDACERLGSLDEPVIQARRGLFTGRMRLEVMLADLGSLRAALDRDYQKALNDIFRPSDAAPGSAHQAVARLGVRAILTTNYDGLLERLQETQHRQPYTWKESDLALNDLESGRQVLLKVHGTAERHDTVVMTEREYHEVRSNPSYRAVLGHLLQGYTFLFIGYGMNDPLDLDLVLKWNADAFKSAARRHYALLKDPSDNDRDRYEREYNVRVIPYSDHAQLPAILEELQRAAS